MAAPSANLFFGGLPADFTNEKAKEVFGAYGVIVSSKFLPGQGGKHSAIIQYKTVDEAAWIVENLNGNIPEAMDTPVTVKFANDNAAATGGGKGAWGKTAGGGGGAAAGGPWGGAAKGGAWGGDAGKGAWGGKDGGKGDKNPCGIKMLVNGLMQAGALPGGKWSNDKNALFVSGIPEDTTDVDMYAIFAPFGAIPARGVKVMCNPDGTCKGFGFVNYVDEAPMQAAVNTLNGTGMPNGKTLSVRQASSKGEKGAKGEGKGEGKTKECKWCKMGECWDHGQIGKPGKGEGK